MNLRGLSDTSVFCVYCRDLLSWINSIYALVTSEDLARDVAEAEALQDRHQVLITFWKFPLQEINCLLFELPQGSKNRSQFLAMLLLSGPFRNF